MNVQITEASTSNQIATYPIILGAQNYTPSVQEYFNEAWRCAVDDNLVSDQDKEKYSFNFVP